MIEPSAIHPACALAGVLALSPLGLAVFLPTAAGLRELPVTRSDEEDKKLSSLAARIPTSEIRDELRCRFGRRWVGRTDKQEL
jgi:hypothetical protein